jgi:DNA-binding beta-propeller fold protein YncE
VSTSPLNPLGPDTVSQYDVGADGALISKTPPTVAAGSDSFAVAVSPDGQSAYVANLSGSSVSQYDVGPGGTLLPKSPPTIAAGFDPDDVAVSPLPRMPTIKAQCKNGGWSNFPQFKNQGECIAFVERGL